jgi:ribA/ribD-fused uncharacterized protein
VSERLVIPKFEGDDFYLSNFHPSPINLTPTDFPDGLTFYTGEHMFQALKWRAMKDKTGAGDYVKSIAEDPSPQHAKKAGREVEIDLEEWDAIKIDMMRETVWQKFKQNLDLRNELLATGSAMLVEGNTWGDKFWGRVDGKGTNMLGSILMEVRGGFRYHNRKL